jgi:hypothetical protein
VRRVPTETIPAAPTVDVHLPEPIRLTAPVLQSIGNTEGSHESPLRFPAYASDSDDDDDPISISTILSSLHATYPALNYPQYADTLRLRGICYAVNVSGLDNDFFIYKVGMAEGAIRIFLDQAKRQIEKEKRNKARRRMKGKKRAHIESDVENTEY